MYVVIESERQGRTFKEKVQAVGEARNLRGIVDNIEQTVERNKAAQEFMETGNAGRPGHYYGRDVVIEGAVPEVAFYTAPNEFAGDIDWFKDDRKFQQYMRDHPEYNWLKRR